MKKIQQQQNNIQLQFQFNCFGIQARCFSKILCFLVWSLKNIAEPYKTLALNFAENQNVLIAEMEWTQHQIDAVEIKGFPTLVFFKKGGKKAEQIKFQKACSTESMEEFIKENISFQREDL